MTVLIGIGGWILYALMVLGLMGWGELFIRHVLRIDLASSRTIRYSFSIAIGFVLLSLLLLYITILRWVASPPLWGIGIFLLGSGLCRGAMLVRDFTRDTDGRRNSAPLICVLALIAVTAIPLLVLPPVARDGLVYHLEVPRQILLHHGFSLSSNIYSYFPMGIEMLYLFSLGILPAPSAQFVHFGFLLLTVLAVVETFGFCTKRVWPLVLFLGIAAMVTVPTYWLDATWAYIDVAWAYFGCLLVAGCFLYFKHGDKASLTIAAFIGGFYLSIKYPGFYFFAVLVLGLLLTFLVHKLPRQDLGKTCLLFLISLAVTTGPYFIRNVMVTGNPVFPFFKEIIPTHSEFWSTEHEVALVNGLLHQYGNQTVPQALRFVNFLAASFNPVLEQPELFDGVLGPFLLLWIAVFFLSRKRDAPRFFLLTLVLAYGLIWSYSLRQARFLLPIIPIILLLFMDSYLEGPPTRRRMILSGTALIGILAFNLWVLGPAVKFRLPAAKYFAGRIDREAYLSRALPVYPCQKFINEKLPGNVRIWVMLTGNENFYLQRAYQADYVIEDYTFHQWLESCHLPKELSRKFAERGITHFLARTELLFNPLLYIDKPDKLPLAAAFFQSNRLLFQANGFAVYELGNSRLPGGGLP